MAFCMESDEHEEARPDDVVGRGQWLRAAILGANDGLLSTTSLMLGVGAAKESKQVMVLAGVAGAVAGALSMALGEFVSVSTQRDIEKKAALKRCSSLESSSEAQKPEKVEMKKVSVTTVDSPSSLCRKQRVSSADTTNNFNSPGRSPTLRVMAEDIISNSKTKRRVVEDVILMSGDEESGKHNNEEEEEETVVPNPYKAAAASALAFLCGSLVPLAAAILVAGNTLRVIVVVVASSLALVVFGGVGAYLGGSPVTVSAVRVLVGGWIAMGITYGLLKPFHKDKDQGLQS